MSGEKVGRLEPSPRVVAQQLLGPLAAELARACNSLASVSSGNLGALRDEVADLRRELAEFKSETPRAPLLDAAYHAERALKRFEAEELPTVEQLERARRQLDRAIANGEPDRFLALDAQTKLRKAGRIASAEREMAKVLDDLRARRAAVTPIVSIDPLVVAARASIEAERDVPVEGEAKTLGGFDATAHGEALQRALAAADAGDVAAVDEALAAARALRSDAAERAGRARQQIDDRDHTAAHLVEALRQLHYDEPDVHLDEREVQGELAPLVIYGHNPGGRAHVRLTLQLDGQILINVDDVPVGQEETCVALLGAFARAANERDVALRIVDAGRAAHLQGLEPLRVNERQRERG